MDKPHTDYRSTGIEAAGILHRLLYGTWETIIAMSDKPPDKVGIQGIPEEAKAQWSGGLDRSSDEVSVMEMERRVQLTGLH